MKKACSLGEQPEDIEPSYYTHFDCWTDDENSLSTPMWKWDSKKSQTLMRELCTDWHSALKDPRFMWVSQNYLLLGQILAFDIIEKLFIDHGYCVYSSDTMFEAYPCEAVPKKYAEEE